MKRRDVLEHVAEKSVECQKPQQMLELEHTFAIIIS